MNYYEHHLGDWAAATGHLTWDEDMAYTRLLRAYYHHEKPIPHGQQYRLAKASTPAQRKAVDAVLQEFFTLDDGHYHQKRADEEIARYQDKQAKARRSADARWSAKRQQSEGNANALPDAMRTHSEGNAHQTPDTRHQTQRTERGELREDAAPAPSPSGLACKVIKAAGVLDVNPSHPGLLRLLEAGVKPAEFGDAAQEAVSRGKPRFAYVLSVVEGRRKDAAEAPAVAALPPQKPWHEVRSEVIAMGCKLGIGLYREIDDSTGRAVPFEDYRRRVMALASKDAA